MRGITAAALLLAAATAGCAAGGYGGGSPLEYRAVALNVPAGASADSVAAVVRQAAADLALVVAPADSSWFMTAARAANLHLSGPTRGDHVRLGFLAMKPTGDTTLTLSLPGGKTMLLHDALYQPRKNRYVDLMLARVDSGAGAQDVAHALLTYAATDVMQNAGVILGMMTRPQAVEDSVAGLIRAVFVDLRQCAGTTGTAANAGPIRIFYGPETNIRCDDARLLPHAGAPVYAHFTLGAKP